MRIFETLKPANKEISKYVSYYYLDIATETDYCNEYICYPHYNNTVSLYKSHGVSFDNKHSQIRFTLGSKPIQIFTPLREHTLKVTQIGPVHKIGIVFEPFGINQFISSSIAINNRLTSPEFTLFEQSFLIDLFQENDFSKMVSKLDQYLHSRFSEVQNPYLSKAITLLHESTEELNIDELAETKLGISRKHLNRIFKKYMGTTAQKYKSIVRFRQLMNYKLQHKNSNNLSSLSHQAHYTDQSHFIKACKQLTGLTPSQFFKDGKIVGSEDTFWKFIR
ncbi:helix-turn-helix domain-containing protein [Pedobacter namyangjuensis]|uniref:helix-turn-helix domain-containing protein n=1 Tax=Pedobacter namyangjuensis TaxID=600626 RepID=UPI000DE3A9AE|nr:helix-turn-helix transcriptional regulator [Pedobacter namyangjuensis]